MELRKTFGPLYGRFIGVCLALLIVFGCSGVSHVIKFRARAPMIEEAFRLLTLALRADDYKLEHSDEHGLRVATGWRSLKENERRKEGEGDDTTTYIRLALRIEERGSVYDVMITFNLRAPDGSEYFPDRHHPVVRKWERILEELLKRDESDEG